MRKMKEAANNLMWRGVTEWNRFKAGERGDTNFISILLILAIVISLAIAFAVLGDGIMEKVEQALEEFWKTLEN